MSHNQQHSRDPVKQNTLDAETKKAERCEQAWRCSSAWIWRESNCAVNPSQCMLHHRMQRQKDLKVCLQANTHTRACGHGEPVGTVMSLGADEIRVHSSCMPEHWLHQLTGPVHFSTVYISHTHTQSPHKPQTEIHPFLSPFFSLFNTCTHPHLDAHSRCNIRTNTHTGLTHGCYFCKLPIYCPFVS